MIHQLVSQLPKGADRPIVVIGSGAVGLFLAKCLLLRGSKVIVIEAGQESLDSFDTASYRVIGRKHEGIRIGRSRSLGGTSNLWGGQLVEFSEMDFRAREWVAGSGWPLDRAELQPYYERSFRLLGIDDQFHDDLPIWQAIVGEAPRITDSLDVFLTRWMNVPSMARQLRTELEQSEDLHVLVGHVANGFSFVGDRVVGVRVRSSDRRDVFVPCDTIVVAAGAIETSRLMLAAALDPNCPWRGNEMLGRRFQDHLGGRIASIIPKDRKALDRIFATVHWQRNKFQPKVRLARSCIEDKQVLGALGMVTFESSVSENLNFLKQFLKAAIHSRRVRGIGSFFTHTASCAKHLPPLMFAYLKDHRVLSPANSSISLVVQAEQCPLDDSRILVDRQAMDVHGLPAAVLDWRLGNAELRSIRELALQCDLGFREAGLGSLDIDPDLLDCNPRMLDKLRDTNHSAGGCIMSASPATGVVDPTLKVYGTSNTYVAGASVFPTSSDANVTFTAMALACRLADRLTGEHAA